MRLLVSVAASAVLAIGFSAFQMPTAVAADLKQVFVDDFDGEDLADHWEVINPDPDAFIVEEGGLLMLSTGSSPALGSGEMPNVFRLVTDLPKGDWVLTATYNVEFQTNFEAPFLGLYTDPQTYIAVQPRAFICGNWSDRLCLTVEAIKLSKGKVTRFDKYLINEMGFENFVFDEAAKTIPQPITLRIVKKGRKYSGGMLWKTTDAETNKVTEAWVDLPNFTVLRQKGKPAVGLYQVRNSQGESVAVLDQVTIEVAE